LEINNYKLQNDIGVILQARVEGWFQRRVLLNTRGPTGEGTATKKEPGSEPWSAVVEIGKLKRIDQGPKAKDPTGLPQQVAGQATSLETGAQSGLARIFGCMTGQRS
jgi:hypothetical protein